MVVSAAMVGIKKKDRWSSPKVWLHCFEIARDALPLLRLQWLRVAAYETSRACRNGMKIRPNRAMVGVIPSVSYPVYLNPGIEVVGELCRFFMLVLKP